MKKKAYCKVRPKLLREGNYVQALRRGHGPKQYPSSMSTYLTICNLLIKQEILKKERSTIRYPERKMKQYFTKCQI